ncbi:AAA family ATPase [Bernardetia sp. MNP-M8]|uniref:AAA family ATPase n=1 Tax=Bernardetia sp. MNP-M8 TaxID=3127470 RepID=UPI0030CE29A6
MILNIKNLGALKEAEIDLSKDLILLCGHNNTGKTYVAYLFYYLKQVLSRHLDFTIEALYDISFERYVKSLPLNKEINNEAIIKIAKEINTKGKVKVDFLDLLPSLIFSLKDEIANEITDLLINRPIPNAFFAEIDLNSFFDKKTSEKIQINIGYTENTIKNCFYNSEVDREIYLHHKGIKEKKQRNSNIIEFELTKDISFDLIKNGIYLSLLHNCLGFNYKSQIFTSERAAINIFSKELALNKNQFFDKILKTKGEERNKLLNFADENINRYVKPIADELLIAEDLLNLSKQKSEFDFLAIELEKSILEGKIIVGQYGGLQYQPNFYNENEENVVLEIAQTSSLVKSLASLVFYLRHLAKKNDCIIIDEPELNLHPDNQILVARFLARLVNEGFKVVASTHSDYIIRELSNLLMLSNSFGEKEELMKTYRYNENELLKNEQVGVYYFEKGKNTAVSVPLLKRGIEIDSINEVITDLNERSDNIYYTFLESDENKAAEKEEENLKNNSKI